MKLDQVLSQSIGDMSRRAWLDAHGLTDVHTQHVYRWLHGTLRSHWVPRILHAIDAPPATALVELAERLGEPVDAARDRAKRAAESVADARLIASALDLWTVDDAVSWCARAARA